MHACSHSIVAAIHKPWKARAGSLRDRDGVKVLVNGFLLALCTFLTVYCIKVVDPLRAILLDYSDICVAAAVGLALGRGAASATSVPARRAKRSQRAFWVTALGVGLLLWYNPQHAAQEAARQRHEAAVAAIRSAHHATLSLGGGAKSGAVGVPAGAPRGRLLLEQLPPAGAKAGAAAAAGRKKAAAQPAAPAPARAVPAAAAATPADALAAAAHAKAKAAKLAAAAVKKRAASGAAAGGAGAPAAAAPAAPPGAERKLGAAKAPAAAAAAAAAPAKAAAAAPVRAPAAAGAHARGGAHLADSEDDGFGGIAQPQAYAHAQDLADGSDSASDSVGDLDPDSLDALAPRPRDEAEPVLQAAPAPPEADADEVAEAAEDAAAAAAEAEADRASGAGGHARRYKPAPQPGLPESLGGRGAGAGGALADASLQKRVLQLVRQGRFAEAAALAEGNLAPPPPAPAGEQEGAAAGAGMLDEGDSEGEDGAPVAAPMDAYEEADRALEDALAAFHDSAEGLGQGSGVGGSDGFGDSEYGPPPGADGEEDPAAAAAAAAAAEAEAAALEAAAADLAAALGHHEAQEAAAAAAGDADSGDGAAAHSLFGAMNQARGIDVQSGLAQNATLPPAAGAVPSNRTAAFSLLRRLTRRQAMLAAAKRAMAGAARVRRVLEAHTQWSVLLAGALSMLAAWLTTLRRTLAREIGSVPDASGKTMGSRRVNAVIVTCAAALWTPLAVLKWLFDGAGDAAAAVGGGAGIGAGGAAFGAGPAPPSLAWFWAAAAAFALSSLLLSEYILDMPLFFASPSAAPAGSGGASAGVLPPRSAASSSSSSQGSANDLAVLRSWQLAVGYYLTSAVVWLAAGNFGPAIASPIGAAGSASGGGGADMQLTWALFLAGLTFVPGTIALSGADVPGALKQLTGGTAAGGKGSSSSGGGSVSEIVGHWAATLTELGVPASVGGALKAGGEGLAALLGSCLGAEEHALTPREGGGSGSGSGVDHYAGDGKGAGFWGLTRRVLRHVLEDRNSRKILYFLAINVSTPQPAAATGGSSLGMLP